MSDTTIYPGTLYDYAAGVSVGVLVTERVMRKLVALQAAHLEAVKRLLADSGDEVFPSMWTLHYPGGVQTHVTYIDSSRSVEGAIRNASVGNQPRPRFPVFLAGSMDEARALADARHAELAGVAP
jgi:hypothetical protein